MGRHDEKDLRMMADEDNWPLWPRLPLKNVTKKAEYGLPELGFILAGPWDGKVTVYVGPIWTCKDHKDLPTKTYDSPEAMLADGWEVD